MKILMINLEFDPAGVSWQLTRAINNLTEHRAAHVMRRDTMAAKNTDRRFKNIAEIIDLIQWADVLHFNQWIWTHKPGDAFSFLPLDEYRGGNPFESFFKDKKVFFHFHGGFLQLDPSYWIAECARVGARMFKCDPYTPIEGAKWMPNILDLSIIPFQQEKVRNKLAIMGSTSDTRRINHLIESSLQYLQKTHFFTYQFYGEMDRLQALKDRASYGISIDNTTQGFIGMWGWESLALGQILLARIDEYVEAEYLRCFGKLPPIFQASNIDDIGRSLIHYLEKSSEEEVQSLQFDARQWILSHYTPEKLVELYIKEYSNE